MADEEKLEGDYYIPTVDKEGNLTGHEVRPLTQVEKKAKKLDKLNNLKPNNRGVYSAPPKKKVKKKSGGLLKAAPNEGVTKLPKDVRNKMGFLKKGGAVKKMKKCRMDGIALRGKTRAKQRSK